MSSAVVFLCAWTLAAGQYAAAIQAIAPVQEVDVDTPETDQARSLSDWLASNSEAAETLARRILRSRIAGEIVPAQDSEGALDKVRQWVQANSLPAAHLAIGFAKDDASGTHDFEDSLFTRVQRRFELNEKYAGLLDRLHQTALESEELNKPGSDQDEVRQGLKRLFEGQDTASGRLIPPGQDTEQGLTQTVSASYDRLKSQKVGKSPQVLAYQREMNLRRPPWAPRLVETGRLDFDTLRYPYYALRYDIERLRQRLKARPQAALDAAERALRDFDAQAQRTKEPGGITPEALKRLASKRQDVARWINAAALGQQIDLLARQRGFMIERLKQAIEEAPVDLQTRRLYLARGMELSRSLDAVLQDARRALGQLEEDSYASRLDETDRLIQDVRRRSYRLSFYLRRYVETPLKLLSLRKPVSLWHAWVRSWIKTLLPWSQYARRERLREQAKQALSQAFARIAATPP